MIGTKGEWLLRFDIDGITDFIHPKALNLFAITEEAAGKMPSFHLAFSSQNEALASKLTDGAI